MQIIGIGNKISVDLYKKKKKLNSIRSYWKTSGSCAFLSYIKTHDERW